MIKDLQRQNKEQAEKQNSQTKLIQNLDKNFETLRNENLKLHKKIE